MKTYKISIVTMSLLFAATLLVSCDNNGDSPAASLDFSGTYVQQDQMARPAINTVFIASGAPKDAFNTAIPSAMGASYQSVFQSRLLALNSGYTTNALGQTAAQLTGLLATDVLGVKKTGTTTFFDGTNVLTGRALADDVIDVELLLIFGGPSGTSNPRLTKDNVNANDKAFTASFPYLAAAW
ncbi:DUF4331 family protein [Flavobacterium franklandianum]|uniref:DUF4331 domain-containing protein n=1 Tax=Flavobacterium franklandianum TaxID=2594430 RepID=A0A553CMB9_9FLAO|nr:DUF4331 family protein [Flavobacterium franklandianum]TRX21723.1 DUF4331 domain-containing protein [Flavobacterium franklandianum]